MTIVMKIDQDPWWLYWITKASLWEARTSTGLTYRASFTKENLYKRTSPWITEVGVSPVAPEVFDVLVNKDTENRYNQDFINRLWDFDKVERTLENGEKL